VSCTANKASCFTLRRAACPTVSSTWFRDRFVPLLAARQELLLSLAPRLVSPCVMDGFAPQAAAQRRSAEAKRGGRLLCIWEANVFSEVDYASAGQRSRDFDLHGISGYVCRIDPEAPPHHFCHYLCLDLRLAMARLPLDGAQEHLPDRDNRIAGHWITVLMKCLRHGPWLQSSQLANCFFGHPDVFAHIIP